MSIFPWITASPSIPDAYSELNYKDYEINPDTGQTTGKMVRGIEAIKAWAWRTLNTPRFRYVVFPWDYGTDFEDYIGKNFTKDFIESEVQRTVKEALLVHPSITDVMEFKYIRQSDKLKITCKIKTVWGDTDFELQRENV